MLIGCCVDGLLEIYDSINLMSFLVSLTVLITNLVVWQKGTINFSLINVEDGLSNHQFIR